MNCEIFIKETSTHDQGKLKVFMNCEIFIKGTSTHDQGKLKNNWRGTVREAIKDWDVFYRAVFNHVKDCDKCDLKDVLRAYWNLRQGPKHKGQTSIGLAALAMRYKRIGADVELVKKFVANTGYPSHVIKYAHLFDDKELYDILCQQITFAMKQHHNNDWPYDSVVREIGKIPKKKFRRFLWGVASVFEAHIMPHYDDVKRYAAIAEVTLS